MGSTGHSTYIRLYIQCGHEAKIRLEIPYFRLMIDKDKKAFGRMLASMSAVVAWDLIKYELRILNYREHNGK